MISRPQKENSIVVQDTSFNDEENDQVRNSNYILFTRSMINNVMLHSFCFLLLNKQK